MVWFSTLWYVPTYAYRMNITELFISSYFQDHDDHQGSGALFERSFLAPTCLRKASSDFMESLSSIESTWRTQTVIRTDPLGCIS